MRAGSSSQLPGWAVRYRLGVELNKHMPHVATLEQVAAEMGITKQNAYTETCLALGTLVCLARQRLGLPIHLQMVETPDVEPHNGRLDISLQA